MRRFLRLFSFQTAPVSRLGPTKDATIVSRDRNVWTLTLVEGQARAVWLLADFNNWSTTSHPLQQVGEDRWQITLKLAPETPRYCFFVWRSERGPCVIVGDEPARQPQRLAAAPDAAARPASALYSM